LTTDGLATSNTSEALLDELLRRYPVLGEWSRPSLFTEVVSFGTLSIHLCGLSAESGTDLVTGSAADLDLNPLPRAYFELIERASLVTADRDPNRNFTLKDMDGQETGRAFASRVLPKSEDPGRRFARSNGVAVGADWRSACRAAYWELIERDRVLRSWYGETCPQQIALPSSRWLAAVENHHAWQAYSFPGHAQSEPGIAVGVFAFPRSTEHALSYGFAADRSLTRAIERAAAECLQRLGFLWGEALPPVEPPFAPTAEYHQEFYLQARMHQRIRDWLMGQHAQKPCSIRGHQGTSSIRQFADLTPEILQGRLAVAKALPVRELELTLGRGHPAVSGPLPESLEVHPIA
jgi:ribosomal protein S12 methylthiotransferase accessory factor YcaO